MHTQLVEYAESQGEVSCVIDGACYSAAIMPFLAAPFDNRRVGQAADALIHKPMTSVIGGNDVELMKAASDLQAYEKTLISFISDNTSLSEAKTTKMMSDETFLQPKELLKMGFASKIVKTPKVKKSERIEETKSTEEARLAFEAAEKRTNERVRRMEALDRAEKRMLEYQAGSML